MRMRRSRAATRPGRGRRTTAKETPKVQGKVDWAVADPEEEEEVVVPVAVRPRRKKA